MFISPLQLGDLFLSIGYSRVQDRAQLTLVLSHFPSPLLRKPVGYSLHQFDICCKLLLDCATVEASSPGWKEVGHSTVPENERAESDVFPFLDGVALAHGILTAVRLFARMSLKGRRE